MPAEAKKVALTWFERVWNQGSEAAIDELLAPDALMHGLAGPDGKPIRGPEGFKPFYRTFHGAFPDIRITVERAVEEGDMVAVHCRVVGTHRGEGLPVAPTRKPIELWGMAMARVRDGRIVEAWNAYDFMTLYQQVGMLPALSAPPAR